MGSLWASTTRRTSFPALAEDGIQVDVAIVGAGITGITAALFLKEAGLRVALLEAGRVAGGITGRTTAHLTEVLDARYHVLEKRFGAETAALVAESSRAAIEQIAHVVSAFGLECSFQRLPGYLCAERVEHIPELEAEFAACLRAGMKLKPAVALSQGPYRAWLRFENQAQFHVLEYLLPLVARISGNGSHVFENTRVVSVDDGDNCRLYTERGPVLSASRVLLATNVALNLFPQTGITQARSYVIAGPVQHVPSALVWDTEDPYHYVRAQIVDGKHFLLVGGEDQPMGHESETSLHFERLFDYATRFGLRYVTHQWSARVTQSTDGLPLISQATNTGNLYFATGFAGNGMTFGTLAGMILSDLCLGHTNPYAQLYSAARIREVALRRSEIVPRAGAAPRKPRRIAI